MKSVNVRLQELEKMIPPAAPASYLNDYQVLTPSPEHLEALKSEDIDAAAKEAILKAYGVPEPHKINLSRLMFFKGMVILQGYEEHLNTLLKPDSQAIKFGEHCIYF